MRKELYNPWICITYHEVMIFSRNPLDAQAKFRDFGVGRRRILEGVWKKFDVVCVCVFSLCSRPKKKKRREERGDEMTIMDICWIFAWKYGV